MIPAPPRRSSPAPTGSTAPAPSESPASAAAVMPGEVPAVPHSPLDDVTGLLTGVVLASLGISFLQLGGLVTGGTAGLSLLVALASGWPLPVLLVGVNLPFLVLALRRRGWDFTLRTLAAIAAVAALNALHAPMLAGLELEPLYAAVLGNLLAGVGMVVLFRHGASLGGFTVIALLAQENLGWRAGWVLLALDALVVVSALTVTDPLTVGISALGALVVSGSIALNHRPGRYRSA